jgi:GNAT superfamily N-acetyltransferase
MEARLSLETRRVRFEEVSEVLRLIRRAVEQGCRDHYDGRQRRAVALGYASNLYVESLGSLETVVIEHQRRVVGMAQLDPGRDRLCALFVDADVQQCGVGRALLAEIERRALRRGSSRLHGAMSLNAVPFYLQAGFLPCAGPQHLVAAGVELPVVRMEKILRRG